ncbi:hypothetical protein Tco_1318093 [Tanacetum coccineum]
MNDQLNVSYQERSMFRPVSSQGSNQQEFGRGQEQGIDQTSVVWILWNKSFYSIQMITVWEDLLTCLKMKLIIRKLFLLYKVGVRVLLCSRHLKKPRSHQALSGPTGEYRFVNNAPNNDMEFKKRRSKASDATAIKSSDSTSMSATVDRSADFSALDSNAQTGRHMVKLLNKVDKFREYGHGTLSAGYTDSAPTSEMPKVKTADTFTPPTNSSAPQYFGLKLLIQQGKVTSGLIYHHSNIIIFLGWEYIMRQVDLLQNQMWQIVGLGTASEAPKEANSQMTFRSKYVFEASTVPQLTSMSHLTSEYDQYKSMLLSSDVSQPHRNNSLVQMNIANTSQYESWPVSGTNLNQLASPYLQHLNMLSLVSQSKKRKFTAYELLPWHKEAAKRSSRLHNMSSIQSSQNPNYTGNTVKGVPDSSIYTNPKRAIAPMVDIKVQFECRGSEFESHKVTEQEGRVLGHEETKEM